MRKVIVSSVGFSIIAVMLAFSSSQGVVERPEGPLFIVTAEYTPYDRLAQADLVELFRKYNIQITLCVREDELNDDLDELYKVYEKAGIRILFWPLLPLKDGLYLNKKTTGVYLDYLDVIYSWADAKGHKIDAIVVDVEPSYEEPDPEQGKEGFWKGLHELTREMDKESFNKSIAEFNRIIDKIHSRDSLAVAAAFPFVIDDRKGGTHTWEDLSGGPVATVDWDYLAIMMYTSSFVETGAKIGIGWDEAHYLAYKYSRDLKRYWGDKAAVAVGVTNPGTGHEKVIYKSPEQLAPAVAAVKAGGIQNVGIYDLKGMLDSGHVEPWLKMLTETKPGLPEKGRWGAFKFRLIFRGARVVLEMAR